MDVLDHEPLLNLTMSFCSLKQINSKRQKWNAHTGNTLPSPGKYWMQALSPSASLRGNKCACCQHPALPWTWGHRITVSAALTKQGWNFLEADLNPSLWERVSSIFHWLCSHLSVSLWTGCVQYVGERNSMFSQTEAWIGYVHTYQNKLTTHPHLSEGRRLNSTYDKAQSCFFFSLHNVEENCTIMLACTIQLLQQMLATSRRFSLEVWLIYLFVYFLQVVAENVQNDRFS